MSSRELTSHPAAIRLQLVLHWRRWLLPRSLRVRWWLWSLLHGHLRNERQGSSQHRPNRQPVGWDGPPSVGPSSTTWGCCPMTSHRGETPDPAWLEIFHGYYPRGGLNIQEMGCMDKLFLALLSNLSTNSRRW